MKKNELKYIKKGGKKAMIEISWSRQEAGSSWESLVWCQEMQNIETRFEHYSGSSFGKHRKGLSWVKLEW